MPNSNVERTLYGAEFLKPKGRTRCIAAARAGQSQALLNTGSRAYRVELDAHVGWNMHDGYCRSARLDRGLRRKARRLLCRLRAHDEMSA